MNPFVLILTERKPYNLSLDVEQAFPGSKAGVSTTLISLALFLQEHIEVCDLSSQKLGIKEINLNSTSPQSYTKA